MDFLEKWLNGVATGVVMVLAACALAGGCMAMIVVPGAAFILPYEFIEPKWLGGIIGGICFIIVFGGIVALLGD